MHGGLGRHRRRGRFRRHANVVRLFFLFFFLGQNGLHHIAGLRDVREIDFRDDRLRAARRRRGRLRAMPGGMLEMRTNLLRLLQLQRTRVRFGLRNAEFRKNVENRSRLDFKLFREIVDTNLTHPPLFSSSAAKPPLVAHRYSMALAAFKVSVFVQPAFEFQAHLRAVLFGRLVPG
jgi:hypothetical protein